MSRDLHALLYDAEQKMFDEISQKWWKDNDRSGKVNDSEVLRNLIREIHKTMFPAKK